SPTSEKLWKRALRLFPGGISHNIRTFGLDRCGAYPPFMKKADGSHLWDEDGNEYVDWWMTHFAAILGHNHPAVREALQEQLTKAIHFGTPNDLEVIFGEKLREAIPYLGQMRFTSTGSEATMYAARLARFFTNKRLIAKVEGGWHGGNDALGYHISHPYSDEPFFDGVSFEFNNRESLETLLKKHGEELAGIIVEPVLGAAGGIPPDPEFLKLLREETEAREILLIFDEIITGFRLRFGAAGREVYGVEPDLLTLGKITAGGMPLGIYGGREDVMALATPGKAGGCWVGGGTFSGHPLTMAAGIATLNQLQTHKDDYPALNKRGDTFRKRLNNLFESENARALATGAGSMIFVHWLQMELDSPLTGGKIGKALDHDRLNYFQGLLMEQGVFGYHGLGALSFSHSDEDLEKTFEAVVKAVPHLQPETR
ncbi:MAG: aspartate aminotransferase family protein, partial [Candidatus Thorarchaeota archaeon]